MKERRVLLAAVICLTAVFISGLGAGAQEQQRVRATPSQEDVIIERDVLIGPEGPHLSLPPEVVMSRPGEEITFAFVSSEMSFDNKVVKNAPYSAEAVTETIQTLADGNRIVRKTTASIYRDSEGRTRRDQVIGMVGPFAPAGDPPQTLLINDPVANVNYILDVRSRTARKLPLSFQRVPLPPPPPPGVEPVAVPLPPGQGQRFIIESRGGVIKKVEPVYPPEAKAAGIQGTVKVKAVIGETGEVLSVEALEGHQLLRQAVVDAIKQWRFESSSASGKTGSREAMLTFNFINRQGEGSEVRGIRERSPAPPMESSKESLGKQMIEGVEAEGTRTTLTIPANAIGNERPIQIINERWYSPQLQTVVLSRRSDPRSGEVIYRLTNINQSEPNRSLFEIPADYTVKESPAPRVMHMRVERDSKKQ